MASFDEVVPPGQAGKIKASVHTANYKGSVGKSITVTHDDKTQGPITVTLLVKIVGSVNILPFSAMQIGRRNKGVGTPAKLLVRQDKTEQGSLAIDKLVASAPWLKVTQRKVTADEPAADGLPAAVPGDVVFSVLAEGAPVGTSVATISFNTGLTREPKITIPVTLTNPPILTLQPSDLILNPSPDVPGGASGFVLASLRNDLDPKTLTVASDAKAFAVRVDPPGAQAFRVIVDWSGKGKHPPTETVIHIRVGNETVDLPVRVNLARSAKAS